MAPRNTSRNNGRQIKTRRLVREVGKPKWSRTSRLKLKKTHDSHLTNYERVGEFPARRLWCQIYS